MRRRREVLGLLTLCVFGFLIQPAPAIMNEALSFALEAADPYVKKGFSVRENNWTGKMSVGKKKAIKHQLYKGNEYWFWLGSPMPGVKLSVKVYDKKGRPVDVESKSGKNSARARVLAPKTGTYYIVIEARPEDPKKNKKFKRKAVEWALVYGYR